MAHYQVYWRKGRDGPPMASHWYTLGGVISWASPVLAQWVGKPHTELVSHLYYRQSPVFGVAKEQRTAERLDDHCVPPTMKYHKQLMRCLDALVIKEAKPVTEKAPLTNEQHIAAGANKCPYCGSEYINGGQVEIDSGQAAQPVDCSDCAKEWVDTYVLTGWIK